MDSLGAGNASSSPNDRPKSARRVIHHLSRVNPQMMQQVLTIRGLSKERMAESSHGKGHHTAVAAESGVLSNHNDLVGSLAQHTNNDSSMAAGKHYFLPPTLQTRPSLGNSPGQGAFPPTHTAISRPASMIASGNGDGKRFPLHSELTIFYNGMVNVYDISAKKAKALMMLAENVMESPHQNPTANATTAASSSPASLIPTSTVRHMTSLDLPIARKQSLQRFLAKRKDRLNSGVPYGTEVMSKQLAKNGLSA